MSNTSPAANNAANDHRLPFSFYRLPVGVQVVFRSIRVHLDKYARVDCKSGAITYSRWCDTTHSYIRVLMEKKEAKRIFMDLYPDGCHQYHDVS